MDDLTRWVRANRWCWSALTVLALWLALGASISRFGLDSMSGIVASAAFLTIVACGQTLVVATGRGNIDLSGAGTITLAAFLVMRFADGTTSGLVLAFAAVTALGLVVGLLNGMLVAFLEMPAIVVTLAIGYILATGAQLANQQLPPTFVYSVLDAIANGRVASLPAICLVAAGLVLLAEILMRRTAFGRQLVAIGQNHAAAAFASIRVATITVLCFILSALLSAFAGLLLSARVGGAFLDMGTPFLIQSIGAVVVGGTSMLGGSTTFLGTMFGSVLLILIVTIMQVTGLPIGIQEVIQGVVITLILAAAGAAR
jgi:ribose transport system permease protein